MKRRGSTILHVMRQLEFKISACAAARGLSDMIFCRKKRDNKSLGDHRPQFTLPQSPFKSSMRRIMSKRYPAKHLATATTTASSCEVLGVAVLACCCTVFSAFVGAFGVVWRLPMAGSSFKDCHRAAGSLCGASAKPPQAISLSKS